MEIKLKRSDVIWSYIGTIVSMGANFFMLPFLMYYLDGDMLGLWYVFISIGAIANLFDMGFSVTFARNITYCWSGAVKLQKKNVVFTENRDPDYSIMKQVLSACKIIYGILAGLAFLLLLTSGTFYISYITRELPGYRHVVSWFIYAFATFLNLYYGYYASFLRGVGAVDRANKNMVIARLLQIVLMVFLLKMGFGIMGASIAYLAYGTSFRLLGKYYFYSYQGIGIQLKRVKEATSREQIKEMLIIVWYNAWRDGLISVSNYLCVQASTVICSLYLSLTQTGVYSVGVQIAAAIAQIAGTLYSAYQPVLQASYINKDVATTRKTMSLIVMSFVYLFIFGTSMVITIGIPLLKLVRPTAVVAIPILLGLCFYQFVLSFRNFYTSYFSCTNRILYMEAFIFSAVLSVMLSYTAIGICDLGVWGLIAAQIFSQVVYNVWKWPILAHNEMNLSATGMIRMGSVETLSMVKKYCKGAKKRL